MDSRNNYSTTEQVIGKYEGKPLYRRIIKNLNVTTTTSSWTNLIRISDYVTGGINFYNITYKAGNAGVRPVGYIDINNGYLRNWSVDNPDQIHTIVLEYTKTTD